MIGILVTVSHLGSQKKMSELIAEYESGTSNLDIERFINFLDVADLQKWKSYIDKRLSRLLDISSAPSDYEIDLMDRVGLIEAIKHYRGRTGMGLKDSKQIFDKLREERKKI